MPNANKLGILVGGGPAPGINSVISAATIRARLHGIDVVGIRAGFSEIMAGRTDGARALDVDDVDGIHLLGGTVLGTARANPTKKSEHLDQVVRSLNDLGIGMLVTVGGLLSTGALMVLYFQHNLVAVLISITLLGVAHAIGVSPQITLMTEISKRHADEIGLGTTIGIFRLVERLVRHPQRTGGIAFQQGCTTGTGESLRELPRPVKPRHKERQAALPHPLQCRQTVRKLFETHAKAPLQHHKVIAGLLACTQEATIGHQQSCREIGGQVPLEQLPRRKVVQLCTCHQLRDRFANFPGFVEKIID